MSLGTHSPPRRIAVVNRGDAALRCVRALRELRAEEGSDLIVIALFVDSESNAPFVRLADEAISLGPALRRGRGTAPRPVYLDRNRVLAALRATRADGVWPGWGFVAEDPDFVEMLEARGIAFLGPGSRVMRALGDKIAAKRLAEAAGVPVAAWSGGPVREASLDEAAARIGFPLVVKATAGGGGRGIRAVHAPERLAAAVASARAEAAHAFGNDDVFLERLVTGGRHIEVQIAADQHGGCVALGLRDCSVQRRHQKVIEEAPPPGLDAGVGRALRDAAVRLARVARYTGLGTVEFLVAGDGRSFFFLEVNPRLQVEHGLTEALTGLDLVKLQVRIARGERLPAEEPEERGHAIEARVCAEDPDAGFMPAPGRIVRFDLPAGPGIRIDTGIALDGEVPAEFDPLVAKVVSHAAGREEARARLACALLEFRLVIQGGASNKGLLIDVLDHPDYRRGGVDVGWLESATFNQAGRDAAPQALIVAAILAYLEERDVARVNFLAEAASGVVKSVPAPAGMSFDFTCRGQAYRVAVFALGEGRFRLGLDGQQCVATVFDREPYATRLGIADRRHGVTWARSASSLRIVVDGHPYVIGRESSGQVRAEAPSVVIAVDVEEGQSVHSGQRLGLLETMKIEIAFRAPISGRIKEVRVRPNERVVAGAVLLVIQAETQVDSDARGAAPSAHRLRLPDWRNPLQAFLGSAGRPDPGALVQLSPALRERAFEALMQDIRRVLLGYDLSADDEAEILRILDAPVEATIDRRLLQTLAEVRAAVVVFADTEAVFSRAPEAHASGGLGPSNDARLRMYLRRMASRGAGIAPAFLDRVERVLAHYRMPEVAAAEALERALLRLHATRQRTDARYRLVTALLRLIAQVTRAGVDLSADRDFEAALGDCILLRGHVPDLVADAATELRHSIFELPQIVERAATTTRAIEAALSSMQGSETQPVDLKTLARIADSPALIFESVGAWLAEGTEAEHDLGLQVLMLRRYAPLVPLDCHMFSAGPFRVGRMTFEECGTVLTTVVERARLEPAWRALTAACAAERDPPVLEIVVRVESRPDAEDLRAALSPLIAATPPRARRVCLSALAADAERAHVTFDFDAAGALFRERTDLFGLHPETARRIELWRLSEFDLERLSSPDPVYAFFGRSRRIPDDKRIFVLAEARAAAPGARGALHESVFRHTFHEAMRTLRMLRSERDVRRRLHWNRVTVFVRPPFVLEDEVTDRLLRELGPTMHHIGLEKTVVRVSLLRPDDGPDVDERELVLEPRRGDRVLVGWREPPRVPLRPASAQERRTAEARRRGLVHPWEVVQLFVDGAGAGAGEGGALPAGSFEEFDLDTAHSQPTAVSVRGRPPGENTCGIVFGLLTTPTAKYPEGMQRVLVLSDPTHDMGALAAPECDRVVAALDLASARSLPVEWVTISSGARISMDSGTENLDATAHVVRRIVAFTQAGGEINIVVAGVNVGAQSYFDALSTMLMHTRGILVMIPGASMVLTGRRALEASGGVSAEDEVGIGGFERIMGPSGQAQYYARDLDEACAILMEHYRHTYLFPGESRPRRQASDDPTDRLLTEYPYPAAAGDGFTRVGEIFSEAGNPGRKRPFSMRPVMHALVDRDSAPLERWRQLAGGETAIVWDAHIGGFPACVVGIESRNVDRLGFRPGDGPETWTGGTLFPLSSKKVARALNSASGNRPVVVLANLSGFDGSPESMRKLQLEYGAEIARAVVNFKGPILFVVVSRYHGGAYVVFSRALNKGLTALALEGSYASVIGGGPAATVVFAREVRARTDADPRVRSLRERLRDERDPADVAARREELQRVAAAVELEKHAEMAREFDAVHSVKRALDVGSLDAIVQADRLRPTIVSHLARAWEQG